MAKRYTVSSEGGLSLPHEESIAIGAVPAPSYITNHSQRQGVTSRKSPSRGRASGVCISYRPGREPQAMTKAGKLVPTAEQREQERRNQKYERDIRDLKRKQGYIGEHAGRGW